MRNDDLVAERIDAALRSYAAPPEGIDPRTAAATIFARARRSKTRHAWLLWRWAIPALACLLALAIGTAWLLRRPAAPQIASIVPAPPPAPTLPVITPSSVSSAPVHATGRRPTRIASVKEPPLPKLDVFPTPAPLTAQEQALLVFLRTAPPAVTQAVIDEQRGPDQPIANTATPIQPPETSGISKTDKEGP